MKANVFLILAVFFLCLLLLFVDIPGAYAAVPTGPAELVSVDSAGNQGNGNSYLPSISADGRYVAFASEATNLIGPPTSGTQIFLRDRVAHTTALVSKSLTGSYGNGNSDCPSISADGRYVAFSSDSTNLFPGTTGQQIFVRDTVNNSTNLISVNPQGNQGNNSSPHGASVSANWQYFAFMSVATNLVAPATSGPQIFTRAPLVNETTLLSTDGNGNPAQSFDTQGPSISADGQYIAFWSSSSLTPLDNYAGRDVFLRDRQGSNPASLVSIDSNGLQGNGGSAYPSVNADGRYIAFESSATNLVTPATSNQDGPQIFLRDRQAGTTILISANCNGNQGVGNINGSHFASICADGSLVVFESAHTNLVTPATSGFQIFVRDWQAGTTALVSAEPGGQQGNGASQWPRISADGSCVAFMSEANNLVTGDNNGKTDVFVAELGPCECQTWDNVTLSWTGPNGQETQTGNCGDNIIISSIEPNTAVAVSTSENCSYGCNLSENSTVTNSSGAVVGENMTDSSVIFYPACADNYTVVF
jgi:Tol biopolymer transport system component